MIYGRGIVTDNAFAGEDTAMWGILRDEARVLGKVAIHAIEELSGDALVEHMTHHCCGAVKHETWNAWRTARNTIALRFACKWLELDAWTDDEIARQALDIDRRCMPYWIREIRRAMETARENIVLD